MLTAYQAFTQAGLALSGQYDEIHQSYGIARAHWELFTSPRLWNAEQRRTIQGIMTQVLNVSMTVAGLPERALPGEFVAAVIAQHVAPPNWMVACIKAPAMFDARAASGVDGPKEVKEVSYQTLVGLTMMISQGLYPSVTPEIGEDVDRQRESEK